MDVEQIAASYGGLPRQVVTRAQENWRITSAKKSAALDQFAGPVACILVAARALNETVDKKRLAKCSGASLRALEPNVRKVMDAVGVRSVVQTSPAALCIKFGCEALTEIVSRVFDEYRAYLGQVAASNKRKKAKYPLGPAAATMNEKDPVFAAACLYAVSKQAKMNVNQDKLLEAVCGNARSFDAIVSSIEAQCQASLSGAIVSRRKRRLTAGEQAAKKLTEQQRLEQEEVEERVKRQKQSSDTLSVTSSQERILQRLRIAKGSPAHSPGPARNAVSVATPEEYAQWRSMALEFMRRKKDGKQEVQKVSTDTPTVEIET
ncbi:hypothetical protein PHYBOEH_000646 [Phytophthora boehmeriae]|uniref:ORC6 second cyclin-like domain-containing protein n=1 Tax=Phytophthora boehmeriae TaxID=109152 RepID=A0A8T1WXH0_9STRA|nr:hypothetical protein PHYBOEH_000646 [Phytophthora boehmeriae]